MPNVGGEKAAKLLPNSLITTSGKKGQQTLYLTFDDGPTVGVTDRVCDVLERHGAVGSFFCIGRKLDKCADLATDVFRRGHSICNHSYTHRNYNSIPFSEQLADVNRCQRVIERINRQARKIFRAPRGRLPASTLIGLKLRGWNIVHWSYDSLDYHEPSSAAHIQQLQSQPVCDGDVLLFHDDVSLCVESLDAMIPLWKESGFTFATVDTLVSR